MYGFIWGFAPNPTSLLEKRLDLKTEVVATQKLTKAIPASISAAAQKNSLAEKLCVFAKNSTLPQCSKKLLIIT